MANSSNILKEQIGSINTSEDFSKVNVDCISRTESTNRASLAGAEYSVVFPRASKSDNGGLDVVPLIGGSIVKIKLGFKPVGLKPAKSGKYDQYINPLGNYAKNKIENLFEGDQQKISELVSARVRINKALENMPSITSGLHSTNAPSVYISALRSVHPDAIELNKELDEKKKRRLSSLNSVGILKYIPIDKIKLMLEKLTETDDDSPDEHGLAQYVGLSGRKFIELSALLSGLNIDELTLTDPSERNTDRDISDDNIARILLDIFPIFHVSEDILDGGRSQNTIGYYTQVNGSIYIKTPDLSGRNSSGVFNYEETIDGEKLFYCFELINSSTNDYKAIGFESAAPPDIVVTQADTNFPADKEDIEIFIESEGHKQSYSYYLSPIIAPKQSPLLPVGFKKSPINAMEVFTAPLLTYPYFDPSDEVGSYPIMDSEELASKSGMLESLNNLVFFDSGSPLLGRFENGSLSATGYKSEELKDLGVSPAISGESIGVNNSSDLLGEMNRAEIILGSRDSSKETFIVNDGKWFNRKVSSARNLMASVCPNILADQNVQIPKNWIKLSSEEAEDGSISLKIPYADAIDQYYSRKKFEFALYAVDKYGQFIRAFGENVVVSPSVFVIEGISTDGSSKVTISLDKSAARIVSYSLYTERVGGVQIVSDITDGFSINGNEIIISSEGTSAEVSLLLNVFLNVVGNTWVELKWDNGAISDRYLISIEDDTIKADEDPVVRSKNEVIKFEEGETLTALRFGAEIDSIPLIMDGETDAEIILKYSKGVFKRGRQLYAYIAIANTNNNRDILSQDIGWIGEASTSEIVGIKINKESYYVPLAFEYTAGTEFLSRINNRKVKIKFPGPGANLNISRFNQLNAINGHRAYILLVNEKIEESITPDADNFAVMPIGSAYLNSTLSGTKEAFISPPYINALVTRIGGEAASKDEVFSNVSSTAIKEYEEFLKWADTATMTGEVELKSNDRIKRLGIIFDGPSDEPRKKRSYSVTIGSGAKVKKISNKRIGLIRGKNNKLVDNYFNITDIKDTGLLDVVITKKDKRFNATYNSVVYSRITVNFSGDEIVDGSILGTNEATEELGTLLASGKNKRIHVSKEKVPVAYPNIFPTSIGLSPIPIIAGKSFTDRTGSLDSQSRLLFVNPIKIFPSVGLVFGTETERGAENGMLLSDASDIGVGGEVVKINTSGEVDPQELLADVQAGIRGVKEQGESQLKELDSAKEKLRELKDGPDELSAEKIKEIDGKIQDIEKKQSNYKEALSDAETASGVASDASAAPNASTPESAAAEAAGAATEAAGDALGLLEGGLAAIQSITDTLSSLTQLANQIADGVAQSASSMEPRANDFSAVGIRDVFIDKDSDIPTSFIYQKDNNEEFKLVLTFKFGQTSAIKFNVPEIIKIVDGGTDYIIGSNLDEFKVVGGKAFVIIASGVTKGTKLEIGGRRVKIIESKRSGINTALKVVIPEVMISSLYGSDDCIKIALTNSNEKHILIASQLGNDLAIDMSEKLRGSFDGGSRNKKASPADLKEKLEEKYLKFTSVTLDKANVPKELIQSFCDMSFHLTAELSLQLRNFKVLMVPIKVIFCIIDVICALLNPVALVFAIIRLFLCIYDLILLLPQLSVPAMLLALVLHVVELLLCVIIKVLGTINAINEISTAIKNAIEQQNYPAIIALEETINEHLASLEADLTVLDPILNILALFLELLQLSFAFPCQIATDSDDAACIDPSQLAGLILGKIAPAGKIVPDALLPMAQSYTVIDLDDVGSGGNTPPTVNDPFNQLIEAIEGSSSTKVVSNNTGFGGRPLPGISGSLSGSPILIEEGGFFSGDLSGDGYNDNVDYEKLRFKGGDFDATFSLSFTDSTKIFNPFVGPDPRFVYFNFKEFGKTDTNAFNAFLSPFFPKKIINSLQTLDSPPAFVAPKGKSLVLVDDVDNVGFTSPIDGASDSTMSGGLFLSKKANTPAGTMTYHPKPLTITFELQEPGVNPDTFSAEFTPVEVTKTFGSIPMIALVDDEFNVYFVEESAPGQGGIEVKIEDNGMPSIVSIHAKMINFPTAPKKSLSLEDRQVYRDFNDMVPTGPGSLVSPGLAAAESATGVPAGQIIIWQQANYDDITGNLPFEFFDNGDAVGSYDYVGSSDPLDVADISNAVNSMKVLDFPRLYIVDMRQLADDIAAACGASGPTELLLDLPGFSDPGKIEDSITTIADCTEAFLRFFNGTAEDASGIPFGVIPRIRKSLEEGDVPDQVPIRDVVSQYNTLKDCYEGEIQNICGFVLNPLNTSFKLMGDNDETPLTEYVDPEQEGLATLINYDIVDELEFDEDLDGFPKITGAMEYASGIGDSAIVGVGEKAIVKIIPRDCYDDILSPGLDLTNSIQIDFLKDETGGAKLVSSLSDAGSEIFTQENGEYTFAVEAPAPGLVKIRATICSTVIKAVTDRGIVDPRITELETQVDCVDDSSAIIVESEEIFAPGALSKVDRILTIMFVQRPGSSASGDKDRENSAKSSKPSPQAFGTKLEN